MHDVLAWGLAALIGLWCLVPGATGQQNVLLIIADDLGVDRVAAYELHPDPGHTPVIDGLAAQGLLFRNAVSNPLCSTTRATMLTGRYSFRTGIGTALSWTQSTEELPLEEVTLPEVLGATHHTAAVGKWHLTSAAASGPIHPLLTGFDEHRGSMSALSDDGNSYHSFVKYVDGVAELSTTYATTDTVNDALEIISGYDDEPWFVWLAFNAPHEPWHKPPAELHTFDLPPAVDDDPALHFKAAVEAMDTEIGRLLASIDPDVLADTLILFVGDNGTPKQVITEPFPFQHGKPSLYQGGIHVPLIAVGPGVVAGAECDALVNTTDLFATICEVAGADASSGDDSISLVPYFSDPERLPLRSFAYAEKFQPYGFWPTLYRRRGIRERRFKLILGDEGTPVPTQRELYDLIADPFEQTDLLLGPLDGTQQLALERLQTLAEDLEHPWADWGGAVPGAFGLPKLRGYGPLVAGEELTVIVNRALPGAPAWLVLGFDTALLPFSGGVLVPTVDLVIPLGMSATGSVTLTSTWPADVPPELITWIQFWISDPVGPFGMSASNGLSADPPDHP